MGGSLGHDRHGCPSDCKWKIKARCLRKLDAGVWKPNREYAQKSSKTIKTIRDWRWSTITINISQLANSKHKEWIEYYMLFRRGWCIKGKVKRRAASVNPTPYRWNETCAKSTSCKDVSPKSTDTRLLWKQPMHQPEEFLWTKGRTLLVHVLVAAVCLARWPVVHKCFLGCRNSRWCQTENGWQQVSIVNM